MKHKIEQTEHWQLVGLLALAEAEIDRLKGIEQAIRSVLHVTKEDDEISGTGNPEHICDAIYSGYSVEELLDKLGIELATNGQQVAKKKAVK